MQESGEKKMQNVCVTFTVSIYLTIPLTDKHSYQLHCNLDSRDKPYKSV